MQNRNNPRRDEQAHAPYNFVPLPESVIYVDEPPAHDVYHSGRHSGYIDVTLETRSPLYIRGPLSQKKFEDEGEGAEKNNPQFFHEGDSETPIIPGSSLRGMLRSVFEVITFSKMQAVTNKRLFFRSVDNSSIGKAYRDRMVGNSEFGNKVEAGFLRREPNGDYCIVKCQSVRITRETLNYQSSGPNATPPWTGKYHQHQVVWVRLGTSKHLVEYISDKEQNGLTKAILVLTGNAPKKKKEFVFFFPPTGAEEIPVSDEVIERFHDDDQLTQYQEKAFPKKAPHAASRLRDGYLESKPSTPGDPIFFLREGDDPNNRTLTFIGRAQMFRLPYTHTPLDFVPEALRDAEKWDMTEAVFGRVPSKAKKGEKNQIMKGRAGRVFVTDATLEPDQENIWLEGVPANGFQPKVLSTPKPTTFQHYLEQPDNVSKNNLQHYEDRPNRRTLRLRGHKFYWHRGEQTQDTLRFTGNADQFAKQLTRIRPLRTELTFTFRIHFENLSNEELGALLWAIRLPDEKRDCCHSLGMGKPLGMGAVKLIPALILTKRVERYTKLFNDDKTDWELPRQRVRKPENLAQREAYFEAAIEKHTRKPFKEVSTTGRIGDLLTLLEWKPQLSAQEQHERDYMSFEDQEFRNRPVLPTVQTFRNRR